MEAVQVLLAAMLVHTAHTALEDRERAFNGVGMNGAINRVHIGARTVERGAVFGEALANRLIHAGFVGH